MINSKIQDIILSKTNITEVSPENIVIALSAIGWNFKIYNNSIFLGKKKLS